MCERSEWTLLGALAVNFIVTLRNTAHLSAGASCVATTVCSAGVPMWQGTAPTPTMAEFGQAPCAPRP